MFVFCLFMLFIYGYVCYLFTCTLGFGELVDYYAAWDWWFACMFASVCMFVCVFWYLDFTFCLVFVGITLFILFYELCFGFVLLMRCGFSDACVCYCSVYGSGYIGLVFIWVIISVWFGLEWLLCLYLFCFVGMIYIGFELWWFGICFVRFVCWDLLMIWVFD